MRVKQFSVRGTQFGIDVSPRTKKMEGTSSPLLTLLSEDDEFWHSVTSFDLFWLDDLIETLQTTRRRINKMRRGR